MTITLHRFSRYGLYVHQRQLWNDFLSQLKDNDTRKTQIKSGLKNWLSECVNSQCASENFVEDAYINILTDWSQSYTWCANKKTIP